MRVMLAPDSYKGCLTSKEVCAAITEGILKVSDSIDVVQFPSSDGGEGFCDCMRNIYGGDLIKREVAFPLGNRGFAEFVFNKETKTAFIELASASGLPLVPKEERNILIANTYGTGELICEAVKLGATNIIIGLGGSATNDCGIGMLSAMGMRFLDEDGYDLIPRPTSLGFVKSIDKSQMIDISGVKFTAACDVKNPLCGKNGAAEVFSRQKGASEEEVALLDAWALSFASALGIDPNLSGSGAAGGVGAAVLSVLGGTYVSGASLLVNSNGFKKALSCSDLLITGEGNSDYQTAFGKLVSVVVKDANESGVKSIVLSGGLSNGYEALYDIGADECYSLVSEKYSVDYCIEHAYELLIEKTKEIISKHI